MNRLALAVLWLFGLPTAVSADQVLWSRDFGAHRSSLGLTIDRWPGDNDRLMISSDTRAPITPFSVSIQALAGVGTTGIGDPAVC